MSLSPSRFLLFEVFSLHHIVNALVQMFEIPFPGQVIFLNHVQNVLHHLPVFSVHSQEFIDVRVILFVMNNPSVQIFQPFIPVRKGFFGQKEGQEPSSNISP